MRIPAENNCTLMVKNLMHGAFAMLGLFLTIVLKVIFLPFAGFYSLYLYRRLYRCHTTLDGFAFDYGNVKREKDLSLEEFQHEYDGQRPVLISGLADNWRARHTWTPEQLLLNYGDTAFRISQRSSAKITMKLKDYVSYIQMQHDEDPLYIFDETFGEAEPGLPKDYSVPHLFCEDFFDVLDRDQRPPYRWLIIGPERSGASWHVDPALTSAWNTLLCGRKRWALYPPGRVPLGVMVHVNEEDGDVNIDTPSSLQWWLDYYPLLADEDKPIECTQLPGETIYVPSGWWHCVLNLETTVAVTQNFVSPKNFEFVCLDMAPGYRHKGVCRAGLLALDDDNIEDAKYNAFSETDKLSCSELTRKEKRVRICKPQEDMDCEYGTCGASKSHNRHHPEFSYDINFLARFLDKDRDHYNALWSSSNCIGQREMREWLWKLWLGKQGIRDLIWKGACLALNAGKWSECMGEICAFHELPLPRDDEKLPVGTGSNPVYLVADNVVKIYVEGGLEASLYALGTELEFYSLLYEFNSPLQKYIPAVLASGFMFFANGSYTVVPWDGKGVLDVISKSDLILGNCKGVDFPFGIWNKKQFEYRKAEMSSCESVSSGGCSKIWPYIVTKRCKGKIFAELRDTLSFEDVLNLASFLGELLRNLHILPFPPLRKSPFVDNHAGFLEDVANSISIPAEWEVYVKTLNMKKKDVSSRLTKWGDPIPSLLIERVYDYIPDDFAKMLDMFKDDNGLLKVRKPCCWIHSDIMDDNIHMDQCQVSCGSGDAELVDSNSLNGPSDSEVIKSWHLSHILDFSNLSIGDPISDLIPLHLDIFRGDPRLLKRFLENYKLPLVSSISQHEPLKKEKKFGRVSYLAMCYCILHEDNVLGAIFSLWKELREAKSWEEVEETVWGDLNEYTGFS
ncbi:hypothetical protein RJ639_007616 [Escallonia herrerae]|uniref:JmjC domain-containing protein n=1 Tax=Escallonia herrerae TaxID=1293975 RepID=A0AA88VVI5_9ASTE|nr:hypothetical protein RJ639_007616 [Escallonia herrerae]